MVSEKRHVLAVVRHPVGGIRSYLRDVYGVLPRSRYRFTIVAVRTAESPLIRSDLAGHEAELIEVPVRAGFKGLVRAIVPIVRSGRCDLVHAHGLTAGTASALAGLVARRPLVVTPHEVLRAEQFPPPWGRAKARLLSAILARADVIQFVGHEARANVLEFLPGLAKRCATPVILNGVDVSRFGHAPPDGSNGWRRRVGVRSETFLFGFLGRVMPEKGFRHVIEAVEQLAQDTGLSGRFQVAVVSDGGYIREERDRIERLGLSALFRFPGAVADAAPVLQDLDAVLVPSLREACSLLAIEALVSGCPLIASECVGLRELIEGSPAIGVPPGDATALAEAMRGMMQGHPTLKRNALEFVPVARSRFDSRRVAQALDELFDSLLNGQ